jgi:hypothetical protein
MRRQSAAPTFPFPDTGRVPHLRNSQSQPSPAGEIGIDWAIDAISTPANHDDGRLTYPEQLRRRVVDAHPNRETRRQMHPVQRPLHIR